VTTAGARHPPQTEDDAPNRTGASLDPTDSVFRLSSQVVMEGFGEEGALLLRLDDRHLFEINPTAHYVLAQTDGQRSAAQVAVGLAETLHISEAQALRDTESVYIQWSAQGVVERVEAHQESKEDRNTVEESPRYIRNPDVVLREEDPDGGLVFNPDTNQVQVLNSTGLFIWRQCDGTRDLDGIVTAVQEAFDETPPDQVTQDVSEFVEGMVTSGFIGTVETLGGGG